MNLGEIRQEVQLLAPQPDYSDSDYDGFINEALLEVAEEIIIPDLKRMDSVTTDAAGVQNWVSLSGIAAATSPVATNGFGGILRRVRNMSIDRDVHIFAKLEMLFDRYRGWYREGTPIYGDVDCVALEGSTLWYMKVPGNGMTPQTLMVLYTANPPTLSVDTDTPIFPEYLHRKLLINGAASKIWDLIETDIEKPKVQTAANTMQFENGKMKYREYIARRTRHVITSVWRV